MTVSIVVLDNDTGKPLPGATVELYASNVMLKRGAAGNDGNATLTVTGSPELIRVTNTEYIPAEIRTANATNYAYLIKLKRIVKDIEGVTITSLLKKNSWAWLLILAGVVLVSNRKKAHG